MIISQNSLNKLEAELQRKDPEYTIFDSYARIIYFIDEIRDANAYSYDKHLFVIYNKQEFTDLIANRKKLEINLKSVINKYVYIKSFRVNIADLIDKYHFITQKEIFEDEIAKVLNIYGELKIFFQCLENVLPDDFSTSQERENKEKKLKEMLKNKKLHELRNTTLYSEINEIEKFYQKIEKFLLNEESLEEDEDDLDDQEEKGIARSVIEKYLKKIFSYKFSIEYRDELNVELRDGNLSKSKKKYKEKVCKDIEIILKHKFKNKLLETLSSYISFENNNKQSLLKHKDEITFEFIKNNIETTSHKNKKANAKRIYSYIYNSLKYNNLYNKIAVEKNSNKKPSKNDDAQKEILDFRYVEYEEEIENSYLKKWEEEMKRFHEIPVLKF